PIWKTGPAFSRSRRFARAGRSGTSAWSADRARVSPRAARLQECEPCALRRGADEVLGLVDATGALVSCHLRIRAERTRPDHFSFRRLRRDDLRGRLALLSPLLERRRHVELIRTVA